MGEGEELTEDEGREGDKVSKQRIGTAELQAPNDKNAEERRY